MNSIIGISRMIIAMTLLISGCSLLPQAPQIPTIDFNAESTNAMETISVTLTLGALGQLQAPTNTQIPTELPPPEAVKPSETPTPELVVEIPTETPMIVVEAATDTPIPTEEPETPLLRVSESTNCRAGPSPMYGVEGYITPDMVLPVRGINEGHSWWWVDNPTYPGYHCWVWKWTSTVEGDVSSLPVYFDPWTPTPGVAEITADITAWTGNQSGACPIKVVFAGVIRSNTGGAVRYQWVKKNGIVVEQGWVTLAADTSAYVSTSINVRETLTGKMQLRVISPVRVFSTKVHYSVTCKK